MDNLLNQLQQLFNSSEKWNYYNLSNLPNPFSPPENDNSKLFVKEFLGYSNKTKDIYNVLELIDSYRNLHIVTDYFLGILIYESNSRIRMLIDNQIKRLIPSENISFDNSFKYFWFLICFYHDVGYYYENNKNIIASLVTLENDLKIENKIPKLVGVPKLFHNVKNKYLLYRLEECNRYDHGILGGMLLYDRLIKIYKYSQNNYGNGQNSFIHNELFWSDSMFKYFQLIASVVMSHNIWFKVENVDSVADINMYRNYKLDKLIISNSTPIISLNRHPLLFLLSLVDSIEPTKRYGINFLKKITMIFPENESSKLVLGHINDDEVNKWLKNIYSLSSWIRIELNVLHNSDLEIIV